jgi:uncharacterized phage protein (TIGR02220 family)
MKDGNWIPLDKSLASFLPRNRPYTELEAIFSYTKDIDEDKEKAVREYARIWAWSRTKVDNFMDKIKASKEPEESQQRASKEPVFRIVFNNLQEQKSRKKASKEPEESQKKATTINPNPNTILCAEIISDLNTKGGFKFKPADSTQKHILARLAEGFTKEDFFHVHSVKIEEWKDNPKMAIFLRPKTLYLPDNFQSYLNQKLSKQNTGNPIWW